MQKRILRTKILSGQTASSMPLYLKYWTNMKHTWKRHWFLVKPTYEPDLAEA